MHVLAVGIDADEPRNSVDELSRPWRAICTADAYWSPSGTSSFEMLGLGEDGSIDALELARRSMTTATPLPFSV